LDGNAGTFDLPGMPLSGFRHGGHDFPGHPQAVANVVSSGLAHYQSEKRCKGGEFAASVGLGKLHNGLDMVAQTSSGNGATWARSLAGNG
jgi:hypothetical protein